jgi:4-amino-4-deoxy-L-arabinose transferase-like glycosyltransferase
MIKKFKAEIIIFLAALILRLIFTFFLYGADQANSQNFLNSIHSDGYYEIAYNLIHHKIFSFDSQPPIIPDSKRTPGYPLMIAASLYFFNSLWLLAVLQIFAGSFLPVLGRKLSLEITGNKRVADIAGWLLVIEPVGIWLSVWQISETFFTLFLFLSTLLIIKFIKMNRPNNSVSLGSNLIIGWAGLLLGLATLIRPNTIYLPMVLIAAWCVYRLFLKEKMLVKKIVIFLFIFILTLSPWLYRNYRTFGVAAISSAKEEALFCYLVPSVLAEKYHNNFSQAQTDWFKSEGLSGYPIVNLDKAAWFQSRAVQELKKHPKELFIASGVSLLTFFTHDGLLTFLGSLGIINTTGTTVRELLKAPPAEMFSVFIKLFFSPAFFIIFTRLLWVVITVLFFLGLWRLGRKKEFTAFNALAVIYVAYFALTTIPSGLAVNARFRFPINVFIFIFVINYLYDIINIKCHNLSIKAIK